MNLTFNLENFNRSKLHLLVLLIINPQIFLRIIIPSKWCTSYSILVFEKTFRAIALMAYLVGVTENPLKISYYHE